MALTVAQRAAELGTDKRELVRALKALSRWKVTQGPRRRSQGTWRPYWYRPWKRLMTHEEASALIGVDPVDAAREIQASYPIPWTEERIVDGLFSFLAKHGHWPTTREMRNANGLPSLRTYQDYANANQRNSWVSPRDWWERKIAADPRCDARMALSLRNVLARKEAIERIGFQTYIDNDLATVVNEHPEFGTLYRMPGETPTEPMLLLKVINSTAEPDGSFADYFLRVPPRMRTARQAVAWTFQLGPCRINPSPKPRRRRRGF